MSTMLSKYWMLEALAGWAGHGLPSYTVRDPLEGIDIEREHELIQQKKSQLSSNMRKLVEYRFLKQNQRITESE